MKYRRLVLLICSSLPWQCYADVANPTISSGGLLDNIMQMFADTASTWQAVLVSYASYLFWSLALISMVWTFTSTLFKRDDLSAALVEVVRFFVGLGFFYWILLHGPDIALAIIRSLMEIAAKASGVANGISPSGIMDIGFNIVGKAIDGSSVWSPVKSAAGITIAVFILVLITRIAITMLLQLIATWIVAYAGIIILGFGGSSWTSDIVTKYIRTVIGLGMNIFVVILIVGISNAFINQYYTMLGTGALHLKTMVVMLVACIITASLVDKLPPMLAGIIDGSNFNGIGMSSGAGAAAMGMAAGAVGGAVASSTGGVSALKEAYKSAKFDKVDRDSGGSESAGASEAKSTGSAGSSDGKAKSAKLSRGILGHLNTQLNASYRQDLNKLLQQTRGGRMAAAMRAERTKPSSENSGDRT